MLERLRKNPVALSIRQPWAHHILFDGKDIENRDWPTRFRGPVLIHAGKAYDGPIPSAHADLPRGGIVGMAEIIDCVSQSESEWFVGGFGFVLRNAVPLIFVPCKGKLSFFRPEIDPVLLSPDRTEQNRG